MTRLAAPMRSTLLLAVVAIGTSMLAPRPVAAAPGYRVDRGELRRLLDQIVAAGAPGAAARVVDERGVTQAGSGVADQRTGRPMRPGLHYRVGSVTKAYVATVVLQLVAEGRLSLEDTVERWLPGTLPYGDQVTVRQLLNHSGGVPDYIVEPYALLYIDPHARSRSWAPEELIALVANRPPSFPPGTAWSYSNSGYVLAGMIVEAVTGNGLDEELRHRIVRPLRLRDTYLPVDDATMPPPYAGGYSLPPGQSDAPLLDFTAFNPSFAWAAGAVVSDMREVQRFFRALLRGRLLPPAMLAEMTTSVPTGQGFDYGLGVVVIETGSGRAFGHEGAIPGFVNFVLSTEDGRRQVALVMNAQFASPAMSAAFAQVLDALNARLFASP
jgi:D-alanyl-D-alanine carboxypeptidase